jgi:hypothetical protein
MPTYRTPLHPRKALVSLQSCRTCKCKQWTANPCLKSSTLPSLANRMPKGSLWKSSKPSRFWGRHNRPMASQLLQLYNLAWQWAVSSKHRVKGCQGRPLSLPIPPCPRWLLKAASIPFTWISRASSTRTPNREYLSKWSVKTGNL